MGSGLTHGSVTLNSPAAITTANSLDGRALAGDPAAKASQATVVSAARGFGLAAANVSSAVILMRGKLGKLRSADMPAAHEADLRNLLRALEAERKRMGAQVEAFTNEYTDVSSSAERRTEQKRQPYRRESPVVRLPAGSGVSPNRN